MYTVYRDPKTGKYVPDYVREMRGLTYKEAVNVCESLNAPSPAGKAGKLSFADLLKATEGMKF